MGARDNGLRWSARHGQNDCEIVLGRLNWKFAGSDAGAKRAAIIYSLIATCKQHGIDPYAYLRDTLARLPTTLNKDIDTLLPWNWSPPES